MAAKVLVTGASGLIGKHLFDNWDLENFDLISFKKNQFDLLKFGETTRLLEHFCPDIVVHLAWCSSGKIGYRTLSENRNWVDASLDIFKYCRSKEIWFIGTGTSLDSGQFGSDEYSDSKMLLRSELSSAIQKRELTWIRPYYVFDLLAMRPLLVRNALEAQEKFLKVELTNPALHHDFIMAKDVASAIQKVIEFNLRGEISIGMGVTRSVSSFVNAIGVEWASDNKGTKPHSHNSDAANISELTSVGWLPKHSKKFFGILNSTSEVNSELGETDNENFR